MPRGHSLIIYVRFSGKKRTSMYISRENGDHYYIQTRHITIFSGKTQRKIVAKSVLKYWASISDRAHAPWESPNIP